MSAHETTPGHMASICDFALSITSKPLRPRFVNAFLSAEKPAINMDPSQPCGSGRDTVKSNDYRCIYQSK
jgi:hypothetical protein